MWEFDSFFSSLEGLLGFFSSLAEALKWATSGERRFWEVGVQVDRFVCLVVLLCERGYSG